MYKKTLSLILILFLMKLAIAQQNDQLSQVKIFCNGYAELYSAGIFFVHGHFSKTTFEGELDAADLEKLQASGLKYQIIHENLAEFYKNRSNSNSKSDNKNIIYNCGTPKFYSTPFNFGFGSMGGFYTYDEAMAQLDSMRAWYPNLISSKFQIGTTIENRAIYAVKISDNPDVGEPEKQLLYTAVHHSSEPCGLQQLIYYMYYLLENYNTSNEVKNLIDNLEIYFVPIVNPDGYVYNQTQDPGGGGTWRKNRRDNGLLSYGVDLNRNYGYAWGYDNLGSQPIGSSPWYRGTAAFSEPESQTMKNFIEAYDFLLDMNWHSWGNFLIYPWNYASLLTKDSVLFEEYSRYLTVESHYRYGTCDQTYGYNSNGDADDWGYGDTTAKNSIISVTAEVGSSTDGFWPQSSNIESLCNKSLDMNLRFARLALKYALVSDLSPTYISNTQVKIPVEVYCLGRDVPADFTVSVTPLSPQIISTGAPVQFSSIQTMEKRYDSVSFALNPATAHGTPINFTLNISNGIYTWSDTITKIFSLPDTIFYDAANDLSNWTADDWATTTESYASAPSCFTESPNSNYSIFQSSTLQLTNALDLSTANSAYLLFKAKWETEKSFDWVEVYASADNGSNWQHLCGKYSSFGTDDQNEGDPVYDGFVTSWLQEEIPLNTYTGGTLKIKFVFNSDQTNNFDGFYLDDITVLANSSMTSINGIENPEDIGIFPNPANDHVKITLPGTGEFSFILTDVYGNIVQSGKACKKEISLNTKLLAQGTYFLRMCSEKYSSQVRKIMVVH